MTLGIFLTVLNLFLLSQIISRESDETHSLQDALAAKEKRITAYINNRDSNPACGACLESANKFIKEEQFRAIKNKVQNMSRIPAGKYPIGSPEGIGDPDEKPLHDVRLNAYYMDKYEVTAKDYIKFVTETASNHPEWMKPNGKFDIKTGKEDFYAHLSKMLAKDEYPIVGVSWKNAKAYCKWKGKRLPTEAEWEIAARAKTKTKYYFGNDESKANDYSWNETNSAKNIHSIGQKKPNSFDLYDMHGNVWEWVNDIYDRNFYRISPRMNPKGPGKGNEYVIRGGSWAFDMDSARCGNRASYSHANDDIGFRCAVSEKEVLRNIN